MAHWAGEMEFEFIDGDEGGAFVATSKVVQFLRRHLARGEVEAAARLYEETGANMADELLAEAKVASSTSQKYTAEMFTLARDFANAARVYEMARDYAQAARMYEQGSDFESAARCFEMTGDKPRAAAAFERAGRGDKALELYQQQGPSDGLAECLARNQRYFEAAQVYQQTGNLRAEVEMLRLVPVEHPQRVSSVDRLSDLLERFGRMDQAVQLIVDTVRQVEAARSHTALYQRLARMLDALGRHEQAQMVRARIQNELGGAVVGEQKAFPVPGVDTGHEAAAPGPAVVPGQEIPQAIPGVPLTSDLGAAPPPAVPLPIANAAPVVLPPQASAPSDPFASLMDPFDSTTRPEASPVDAYSQLKAIPIFGSLAMQDMKDLYRVCQEVRYPSGATLIEQGAQGAGLTVILAGQVQVLRVEGTQATPLATLEAGAYVGEMSLVDDAPTSARVVAATPVQALYISRERFEQYLYNHDVATQRIFRLFTSTLAQRLRQSNVRK